MSGIQSYLAQGPRRNGCWRDTEFLAAETTQEGQEIPQPTGLLVGRTFSPTASRYGQKLAGIKDTKCNHMPTSSQINKEFDAVSKCLGTRQNGRMHQFRLFYIDCIPHTAYISIPGIIQHNTLSLVASAETFVLYESWVNVHTGHNWLQGTARPNEIVALRIPELGGRGSFCLEHEGKVITTCCLMMSVLSGDGHQNTLWCFIELKLIYFCSCWD